MRYMKSVATFASLLILAACSGNDVKTTLGLDRGTPDEFRVVSRPPLSVPPEFDLQPPSDAPAIISANQLPASAQAKKLLIDNAPVTSKASGASSGSPAESAFLHDAGVSQVDPKIRQKIAEDQFAAQQQKDDSNWWSLSADTSSKKDSLVDATKESQRIKTNDDTGQPVTTGDTPTVKQKDTGLLGQILGY